MSEKIYTDIAVIGGGVIGSSVCYWLSRNGIETVLIEKGLPASGSSGACDGFIFLQSKRDPLLIELAKESLELLKTTKEDLPLDIELKDCGGMVLFDSIKELEEFLASSPLRGSLEILEGKSLKDLEPNISGKVPFATLKRDEGQLNPLNLNMGMVLKSLKNGSRILKNTEVLSFHTKGPRIEKIFTSTGKEITARQVILCAGAASAGLGSMLGLEIPVVPRKGMIAVTEVMPFLIGHVILDYNYICCKFADQKDSGFTIEQTNNGNILIGSTREFCGFETSSDIEMLKTPIRNAKRVFPFLESVNIIRTFAGLRPYSNTGLPIMGPSESFEDLLIACGHEGDGIALSAVTGRIISEMACKRLSGDEIKKTHKGIDLERFLPRGF